MTINGVIGRVGSDRRQAYQSIRTADDDDQDDDGGDTAAAATGSE